MPFIDAVFPWAILAFFLAWAMVPPVALACWLIEHRRECRIARARARGEVLSIGALLLVLYLTHQKRDSHG